MHQLILGIARSVTRELGGRRITANVIRPGLVLTDMFNEVSDEVKQQCMEDIPAARFAEPSEIANLVCWLAATRLPTSPVLSPPANGGASRATDGPRACGALPKPVVGGYHATMDEALIERLVEDAIGCAHESEAAREAMMRAAHRRQEAILALKALDLPVRTIAERIGVSHGVVQAAVNSAIARHPVSRREERFPYELHVLVASKLRQNTEELKALARSNIERMRERQRAAIADAWLNRWEELLDLPVDEIEREMLGDTQEARDMRQISPFAGALDQDERLVAMKKAQLLAAR